MLSSDDLDRLICLLATWERDDLVAGFGRYPSRFPVDVTPAFLASLSVDRLRHLLLAVCVQNQRLPEPAGSAAAA